MTAHPIFDNFISHLDNEDKEKCVGFVMSALAQKQIDIVTLYEQVLAPSLNNPFCTEGSVECIWKEHVRTSIIRTIIECCYPYVMTEKTEALGDSIKGRALIVCPQEEYHELGARMVADFFTLCGYQTTFIGANTPLKDILDAIEYVRPAYAGISVTNYYNLVMAQKTVKSIVALRTGKKLDYKIVVGGNAFKRNPELYEEMGADYLLDTYRDIKELTEK
jgi:methanogenic corrinoid protein MtbC1